MIPKRPYKPWTVGENKFPHKAKLEEKLRFLTNYAVLAPSSHNTQPWLFRINKNTIEILPNLNRTLDYSDRTRRELSISLGCALANLLVAGSYFRFSYEVNYLPEDVLDDVAVRVKFFKRGKRETKLTPLFSSIKKRHTNRTNYKNKPISENILQEPLSFADEAGIEVKMITGKPIINKISELVYEAHLFAFGDRYFKEELSQWVRSIYTSKNDGMPLFGFGMPGPLTLFGNKLVRYVPARMQSKKDRKLVLTSPALMVITSDFDDTESWLKAGKIFEYIALSLTKQKVSIAPLAGIVEHEDSRRKLVRLLKTKKLPLFFARVGYASSEVHSSPRIPSSQVLVD